MMRAGREVKGRSYMYCLREQGEGEEGEKKDSARTWVGGGDKEEGTEEGPDSIFKLGPLGGPGPRLLCVRQFFRGMILPQQEIVVKAFECEVGLL